MTDVLWALWYVFTAGLGMGWADLWFRLHGIQIPWFEIPGDVFDWAVSSFE